MKNWEISWKSSGRRLGKSKMGKKKEHGVQKKKESGEVEI